MDFYTYSNDVGNGTEAFSVSKADDTKTKNYRVLVQKGKDISGEKQTHRYNFWAFPTWQPGLMVFYQILELPNLK